MPASDDAIRDDDDVDARFAEIVEQLRAEGPLGAADPTSDIPRTPPGPVIPTVNPPPVLRPITPPPPPPPALDVPVWRGATSDLDYEDLVAQVEAEDHYEPPPPRPLPPQEDLHFWGIIGGLVGGTVLMLWLVIFRPDVADWWTWLAILLIVGGFVLLVLRDSDDDDRGDGAVV